MYRARHWPPNVDGKTRWAGHNLHLDTVALVLATVPELLALAGPEDLLDRRIYCTNAVRMVPERLVGPKKILHRGPLHELLRKYHPKNVNHSQNFPRRMLFRKEESLRKSSPRIHMLAPVQSNQKPGFWSQS